MAITVTVHWIRPDGTQAPTKQEIAEYCNTHFNMSLTVPQIAKMGRDATITQETGSPEWVSIHVDYEETEVDPETGLDQPVYIKLERFI